MAVIILTSLTVLLITAAAFMVYDLVTFRQGMVKQLSIMASIIADNSSSALAFQNEQDAQDRLAALHVDRHVLAAAIYDKQGHLFVRYPSGLRVGAFPLKPPPPGPRFSQGYLELATSITQGDAWYGTLYLKSDLGALRLRLRLYGYIALLVLSGSFGVALLLSNSLQRRITQPIMALTETATMISQRRDYSVRAKAYSADELGILTEAFNQMLARIQETEEIRAFLAAIVASTDDGIVGKDLEGKVVSWNSGAERMFGYTAAEMVGQSIMRVVSPDRPAEEAGILEKAREGLIQHFETVRVRKDGQPITVSLTVSPIKNARGETIGVSSISRDISQRRRVEQEAQENRARLAGVIGSAMDAIICMDGRQRITIFNSAAERMFGCPASQALGQPLERFIAPAFREAQRHHLEALGRMQQLSGTTAELVPLAGLRSDGQEFPIEASMSQNVMGGEKVFTVILRDVTERQRSQAALERQAAVLREQAQMLDLANVLARDLEDRIILWNTGMQMMYGWTRTEALGKVSHQLLRTDSERPIAEIRAQLLREGHWKGELVHFHKDGRKVVVAAQWILHTNEQGQPAAILEIHNDLTERKQAEEQIRRLNADLELRVQERTAELTAANKELEAFTYSVAHDLRAPLRHVDAFTRILAEDFGSTLPSEAHYLLENICKGSRSMSRLVDDLLNLARVGRQELKRLPTPLGRVVEEVVAEVKADAKGRNIEWHIQPLPVVECDAGLVKQVFANLLSNAVKYTRTRPVAVIEIGVQDNNGRATLFVRDNGVGFNMKYADKLFGVFQRLHRTEDFEGTGVGLATVDRIVRKHGGRVWAQAEVGRGATFFFNLNRG